MIQHWPFSFVFDQIGGYQRHFCSVGETREMRTGKTEGSRQPLHCSMEYSREHVSVLQCGDFRKSGKVKAKGKEKERKEDLRRGET